MLKKHLCQCMLILLFRAPAIFILDLSWEETTRCQLALSLFFFFFFGMRCTNEELNLPISVPSNCLKPPSLQCLCVSLIDFVFQMSSAEVSYMNKLTSLCVCEIWVRKNEGSREDNLNSALQSWTLTVKNAILPLLKGKDTYLNWIKKIH